jgi:ribosomal protein L32
MNFLKRFARGELGLQRQNEESKTFDLSRSRRRQQQRRLAFRITATRTDNSCPQTKKWKDRGTAKSLCKKNSRI